MDENIKNKVKFEIEEVEDGFVIILNIDNIIKKYTAQGIEDVLLKVEDIYNKLQK